MPVFSRDKEGVLVLTVDGDFTEGELERAAARAIDGHFEEAVPMILDLSGAAGLPRKTEEQLDAMGAVFSTRGDAVARVAVIAAGNVDIPFGMASRSFTMWSEALEWLRA